MNVATPHLTPEPDLIASLKFTQKWDEDQEVSVYVIMLIGTWGKFFKLFHWAVKISSKQLRQNM